MTRVNKWTTREPLSFLSYRFPLQPAPSVSTELIALTIELCWSGNGNMVRPQLGSLVAPYRRLQLAPRLGIFLVCESPLGRSG